MAALVACTKEAREPALSSKAPLKPAIIGDPLPMACLGPLYYNGFSPDTTFYMPVQYGIVHYFLDVDNDSQSDVMFKFEHSTKYSNGKYREFNWIDLVGIDSLYFTITSANAIFCNSGCRQPLDSTVWISSKSLTYQRFDILYLDPSSYISCACFDKMAYAGFIYIKNGKTYLGWIRFMTTPYKYDLIIDAFAIFDCPGSSIRMGEH